MRSVFLLLGICIIFTSSCSKPVVPELNEDDKVHISDETIETVEDPEIPEEPIEPEDVPTSEPIETVEETEIPEEPIEPEEVSTSEPIESVEEPEVPEEPIESVMDVAIPDAPIVSNVEPSVSVENEESPIVAEEPVEIIIPDIPLESFLKPEPSKEREHPDPSTFTDTFTIDYDSLPLSNVVLSEDSIVDFVVNQDVLKLEDEHCWLTTTFVCKSDAVFGADFYIEFLKDGAWYRLPNKSFTEQAFFGQIGREEGDGLYLKEWYANLKPGTYRVVKRIFVTGYDKDWYGDEFVIEGNSEVEPEEPVPTYRDYDDIVSPSQPPVYRPPEEPQPTEDYFAESEPLGSDTELADIHIPTDPKKHIEFPSLSDFVDAVEVDYSSLVLSDVVLTENPRSLYKIDQSVISKDDEYCFVSTTYSCDMTMLYKEEFFIEYFSDGQWYKLPEIEFPDYEYIANTEADSFDEIYLKAHYKNLKAGTYRFVKWIHTELPEWVAAEFVIE